MQLNGAAVAWQAQASVHSAEHKITHTHKMPREYREKEQSLYEEIMAKNLPNLKGEKNKYESESPRTKS